MAEMIYGETQETNVIAGEDAPEQDRLLLGAIESAEQTSYGGETDSSLAQERARSIDDYLGRPYGNEVDGRSQVVSRDVYDTIEWIKPSLLRIFTSGDEVAQFDPIGPEDEAGAKQETDYINYIIQDKNPWFQVCYEWFTDGLLTKNAYAMAYWDTSKTVESEKYSGLTDEQFALLLQDNVEVIEHSAEAGPPAPAPEGMQPQPTQLHSVTIRRENEKRGVKICVLPPERCLISENVSGMSVRDADFFEYWEMKTISSIRRMGFEIEDDVSDSKSDVDGVEDQSRDQFEESSIRNVEGGTNDPSMRLVCFRMCWIRYDYDDDGIAEHRCVIRVGQNILFNEECNGVPVAAIVPTPMPHRHPGLSIRDMVSDLQEIKTAIWRGGLDNLYLANNGRYGVSDKVNLDDMLTSRPGGVVRVNAGLPMQEIFPFTHPVTIGPALQMMEYTDSVRHGRTGTSPQFTGVDPNAISKSHSGIAISQLTSSAGQRVEMIARVFAEGVKELFQIVHELCIKHGHQSEVLKMKGQWVTVNPSQWKKRSDMRLTVGLGTGNKEQLMSNLMLILQAQKEGMQIGVTDPMKIYNALTELTKAAGFASAEKFWKEPPENPVPQPDPNQIVIEGQKEIEGIKQKAETERTQMEIKSKERIEQSRIDKDLQLSKMKDNTGKLAGFEIQEKDGKYVLADRQTLSDEDMNQQQMAQLIQIAQAMQQSAQTMQQAAQLLAMPKRKIPTRDVNGRIIQVDEVSIQ